MMLKLFEKNYSLNEWLNVALLQSLIGGTILAVAKGIWFGLANGNWMVLALFPVTVLVTSIGALLAAALSHTAYRKMGAYIKSKAIAKEGAK